MWDQLAREQRRAVARVPDGTSAAVRWFTMYPSRTTAEIKCEELAGLLATERITAQMPAVTLEELTLQITPVREPPSEPALPVYARGGTARPTPFPRFAVIAISAALTVITALGLATAI